MAEMATGTVLDLSGVFDGEEHLTIVDKTPAHRHWLVDADLPGRTLKTLFRDGTAWQQGQLTEAQMDRMYEAMWHILRRNQPDATLDDVIDAFTLRDVGKIVDFLFTLLAGTATGATADQDNAAAPRPAAAPAPALGPAPSSPSTSRRKRHASATA